MSFKIGNRVYHSKFGHGRVNHVEEHRVTVDFDTGEQKKIIDSFLCSAVAPAFKPTFDHVSRRVTSVDVTEWADDISLVVVNTASIRHPNHKAMFQFVVSSDRTRMSKRFDALLRAAGIMGDLAGTDQLVGRHFAVKNNGYSAEDFDTLEYMAACRQSDIDAYRRSLAYAAEYAAEEALADAA
ncbi:hypothetical protein [Mesorhizobium sp.]|uniref:hypothetical protein n=1 Tax=Mesorhizobium sp. TaxID=1871066 RepID=UPI001217028C|nr:hypothetical protein [Mesorhizobium sp.]TIN10404.1 MAG: hypothetical protein E5Y14_11120 [Mesorhizobium sp.]